MLSEIYACHIVYHLVFSTRCVNIVMSPKKLDVTARCLAKENLGDIGDMGDKVIESDVHVGVQDSVFVGDSSVPSSVVRRSRRREGRWKRPYLDDAHHFMHVSERPCNEQGLVNDAGFPAAWPAIRGCVGCWYNGGCVGF